MMRHNILAVLLVGLMTLSWADIQEQGFAGSHNGRPDQSQGSVQGLPGASYQMAELTKPDRETIRRVQELLTQLGYSPGPVDGLLGKRTREAIRAFQKAEGLPVTGEVSAALLAQLTQAEARTQSPQKPEEALRKTIPAVSPAERMSTSPAPGEYVAFSLRVAQQLIARGAVGQDYRVAHPEVYNLGGINQLHGLVYDRETKEVILVGQYDPDRQPITLDDFVVALRAWFIHSTWPMVSIDPTEETKKTEMQTVRFEGGIEGTQFGADLFEADYWLKKMGMGLLPSGISTLATYWDLRMKEEKMRPGESRRIEARFWFYPVLPSVSVREDVVAIKGLKVGVFTEVLSAEIEGQKLEDLATFQDEAGEEFARRVNEEFEKLATVHPAFSRLQGLDELVALTRAIEEMDEKPELSFWLEDYRVKPVETAKEVKVLRRREEYTVSREGRVYQRYQELSGGVQLMAIALELKAGDVRALREAVLKTRPTPEALSWTFVVGEWLIPTSPIASPSEAIAGRPPVSVKTDRASDLWNTTGFCGSLQKRCSVSGSGSSQGERGNPSRNKYGIPRFPDFPD